MPPKTQQKTKEQKMAAALAGGKSKKKKWSKKSNRDSAMNKVLFDEETFGRLEEEIPRMKVITVAGVVERLKITGSLARKAIKYLEDEGQISRVVKHHNQFIYTRAAQAEGEGEEGEEN
uniref:40S ribosomal protein S25 n=1 Tax=Phaeomonas parva TaxID=124430 RepID=A0A7S1UHL5_9STRA|mmetsp:Transcript_45532/g.142605  ORF Transcript_45532/g.142605 Transcript_45532/m.142605 type:complete len:119 (+) Transcript_45532:163-519(+)|eukprot:CAMPEP_0118881416 /NCGR_PEP_ID=MMETSP1163-20130328/20905_1 /TAXON_ID=124430 /ORGANISM="Phaeomonas parva, Strain CCMP2877" /LENGTH=118 /DNA_ID=CAMNT_0006818197 /DNA_START=116 /DNA_END=472 /DNA_ORIENTATION=+